MVWSSLLRSWMLWSSRIRRIARPSLALATRSMRSSGLVRRPAFAPVPNGAERIPSLDYTGRVGMSFGPQHMSSLGNPRSQRRTPPCRKGSPLVLPNVPRPSLPRPPLLRPPPLRTSPRCPRRHLNETLPRDPLTLLIPTPHTRYGPLCQWRGMRSLMSPLRSTVYSLCTRYQVS